MNTESLLWLCHGPNVPAGWCFANENTIGCLPWQGETSAMYSEAATIVASALQPPYSDAKAAPEQMGHGEPWRLCVCVSSVEGTPFAVNHPQPSINDL